MTCGAGAGDPWHQAAAGRRGRVKQWPAAAAPNTLPPSASIPPLSSSYGAGQTGQRHFAKFYNARKRLLV